MHELIEHGGVVYEKRFSADLRPSHIIRSDLSGRTFSRLTLDSRIGCVGDGHAVYAATCACGKKLALVGSDVAKGSTKSCGCFFEDFNAAKYIGRGKAAFNTLFRNYKRNATKRGLAFNLTKEEFAALTNDRCYYCGVEPRQILRLPQCIGEYVYNGVDRVDNAVGYGLNNCVACCKICNMAKGTMTHAEFIEWIDRVHGHTFRYFH